MNRFNTYVEALMKNIIIGEKFRLDGTILS